MVSVTGGKGKIVEFFGPGCENLSATGMATIGNMSAEVGATSCLFPYSKAMGDYLNATNRGGVATAALQSLNLITPDEGCQPYYDDIVEIDLDTLEPHINGRFSLNSTVRLLSVHTRHMFLYPLLLGRTKSFTNDD